MRSLILGIIGAVIGYYATGGSPSGAMYGFYIGASIGAYYDYSQQEFEGTRLDDLTLQVTSYGQSIKKVYGRALVSGSVIWSTGKKEYTKTEDVGKGGSPSIKNYKYAADFLILVCEGAVDGIVKIWADTELIYDASGGNRVKNKDFKLEDMRISLGDGTNSVDTYIESIEGTGNQPAHKGYCTVRFANFQLERYGNRIPNFRFEVIANGAESDGFVTVNDMSSESATYVTEQNFFLATGREVAVSLCEEGDYFVHDLATDSYQRVETGEVMAAFLEAASVASVTFQGIAYNRMTGMVAIGAYWIGSHSTLGTSPCVVFEFFIGSSLISEYNHLGAYGAGGSGFQPQAIIPITNSIDYVVVCTGKIVKIHMPNDSFNVNITTPAFAGEICWPAIDTLRNHIWICSDVSTNLLYIIDLITFDVVRVVDTSADGTAAMGGRLTYCAKRDRMLCTPVGADPDYCYLIDPDDFNIATGKFNYEKTWASPDNAQQITAAAYDAYQDRMFIVHNNDLYQLKDDETTALIYEFATGRGFYEMEWFDDFNGLVGIDGSHSYCSLYKLDRLTGSTVYLKDVVEAVLEDSGLTSDDYDCTALASIEIDGFVKNNVGSARALLAPLQQAFFFDIIQSDGKIKMVTRGGSSIVTIPYDDIGAVEKLDSEDPPVAIGFTRMQDRELPKEISLNYLAENRNYDIAVQRTVNTVTDSDNEMTVTLPIVMSDNRAKLVSEAILRAVWVGRDKYKFSLPWTYLYLEPGDLITITDADGETILVRIVTMNFGLPYTIEIEACADEPSIYSSTTAGISSATDEIPSIARQYYSESLLFDTHLLNDEPGVTYGFYAAAAPRSGEVIPSWAGCIMYRSPNAQTWDELDTFGNSRGVTVFGIAESALADVENPYVWDRTNTVTVFVKNGDLTGLPEADVLNRENVAILGSEIIAFSGVTDNGDGSYTLDTLLRGLRGTDVNTGSHSAGEIFFLLDNANIKRIEDILANKDTTFYYTSITNNTLEYSFDSTAFTNTALGMKPYSVAHLSAYPNSSNEIVIDWVRRGRTNNEWANGIDVPLGESSELYDIEYYVEGVLEATTSNDTTEGYTLSSADRVTYIGDGVWPVYIHCYQKNAEYGRGYVSIYHTWCGSTNPAVNFANYPSLETDYDNLANETPKTWVNQWGNWDGKLRVAASGSYPGEYYIGMYTDAGTTNKRRLIYWDMPDTDINDAPITEVLTKFRVTSVGTDTTGNGFRLFMRAGGDQGSENGYFVGINGDLSGYRLVKYVSGTGSTLVTSSTSLSSANRYWIRMRIVGTCIKVKIWQDGTSEPSTWEFVEYDTDLTTGKVGIGHYEDTIGVAVYEFALAYGNDTATEI